MKKATTLVSLVLLGGIAAGCSPTTGNRTADGAVLGAAAGGAIGGLATGTWGGAAIGAGKCYWVDKQGQKHYVACR